MKYSFDLSIIIPCYNDAGRLERLLKTIVPQPGVQVIVVDDHSKENPAEMLKTAFPWVEVYRLEQNRGAGACRNVGMQHAGGKWLFFADADDLMCPGYYETLKKYFDSDADMICFAPTSIFEDTGEPADRHLEYEKIVREYLMDPSSDQENKLRCKFTVPWSKLIRRQLVMDHGICFEEVHFSNDTVFSVKCGCYARKVAADRTVVYCVTRNKGSLTTRHDAEAQYIRLKEYCKAYQFLREHMSKERLDRLEWRAGGYLFLAVQQKYSPAEILRILDVIRAYRLPVWDRMFLKKAILMGEKRRREKRFEQKEDTHEK